MACAKLLEHDSHCNSSSYIMFFTSGKRGKYVKHIVNYIKMKGSPAERMISEKNRLILSQCFKLTKNLPEEFWSNFA